MKKFLTNNEIKANKVLLIFKDNSKKEMSLKEALKEAEKQNLDLIQISTQEIPICKLVDYNKFIYEKNKKEKEQRKKQRQNLQETKEIRISSNIDTNDLKTKANQANKFLRNNKKVKLTLRLKGRENRNIAINTINNFLDNIDLNYDKTQKITIEGKIISIMIIPQK